MYGLVVNAPNVRAGGGLVLLKSLVEGLQKLDIKCLLIIHVQVQGEFTGLDNINIACVNHSLIARIKNEFFLNRTSKNANRVLMFGNMPPIFRLSCTTILYLQNAYIVNDVSSKGFPVKARVRIGIERLWFRFFKKNVDLFMVQTDSMRKLLINFVNNDIQVLPFMSFDYTEIDSFPIVDFIYPSSGEPHKNHKNLVNAWVELAKKNIYPELYLTLDEVNSKELLLWIDSKVVKYGLNIKNIGCVRSRSEMLFRIKQSKCMIFPSLLESFGLPLIEAQYFNVPILAPELDYVRDIVKPTQTFDAMSPTSICDAVLRFMNKGEINEILSPDQFINKLIM